MQSDTGKIPLRKRAGGAFVQTVEEKKCFFCFFFLKKVNRKQENQKLRNVWKKIL